MAKTIKKEPKKKIFRQFTANDEEVNPFPFHRELSMESYLCENPQILALDDEVFNDVEIIEYELSIKDGRSRKNTDGRIDLLVQYSAEYLGVVELKNDELEEIHLKQLEDYLEQRDQVRDKYSDIIGQEYEGDPKWIGVLVGTSINPELRKKILDGCKIHVDIPIAAITIQRFRSTNGNIYVTTNTYFSPTTKDYTKYKFNGDEFGKGRLVLAVLKHHIQNNPDLTYAKLDKQFPKSCQGNLGVFATIEDANEIFVRTNRHRYFDKPEECITLSDSSIAVCSQWGGNINQFLKQAESLGYDIKIKSN